MGNVYDKKKKKQLQEDHVKLLLSDSPIFEEIFNRMSLADYSFSEQKPVAPPIKVFKFARSPWLEILERNIHPKEKKPEKTREELVDLFIEMLDGKTIDEAIIILHQAKTYISSNAIVKAKPKG